MSYANASATARSARARRRQGRTNRQAKSANRRGAAAVEFAIVGPIFFLLLLVSIEFSRMNVIRHTADQAAYEAARQAMVPGATAAEAVAEATKVLDIVGARNPTIVIDPPVIDDETTEIVVTIDIPLNDNSYVLPRFTRNRSMLQ